MKAKTVAQTIFILLLLVVACGATAWAAGMVFFVMSKANPLGKTDFMTWWVYWRAYRGDPVIAHRLLLSIAIPAGLLFGILGFLVLKAMEVKRSLYGEARFANGSEIARAGLFGADGIIVGKWGKRYLMFGGAQFVMLAAPTRSGKGVGIVIPNLLNWRDSVVVLDVKQENFMITSGVRAHFGQECYLFNPFASDGKTHRYNPLGYISDNPDLRVTEILAIGYSLYPGDGKDSFFDDAARNLFLGLTLYLCETPELPRTIGELLRQSSGNGSPVKEYLQGLVLERNFVEVEDESEDGEPIMVLKPLEWDGTGPAPLSKECVDALNRFTSTSDNTLSSIMATFNVPLTLWASPIFDAATSENDFDLRDVRKRRMSIYLGIPANKMAESELVLNLFFTQLINLNTDELLYSREDLKYPCMLLMDEFTAPGRIGIIDKANAYMAGYGLRLVTIIQSPGQIEADPRKGYGRESARTLITNHACQILYTPREQRDANEYSEMLGYYTFKAVGRSRQLAGRSGASESESDQKRPLMMPQELKEMSQAEEIINLENTKPIKCEKIAYYSDAAFMDRLKLVSPSLRALERKMPSKKQLEDAWGSGELAVSVPLVDLGLHRAKVEGRIRDVTSADVATTVDLRQMALDTSRLDELAAGGAVPVEKQEAFVNDFFDALAGGWVPDGSDAPADDDVGDDVDETGAGETASDDELAALEAAIEAEAAEAGRVVEVNTGPMVINLDAYDAAADDELVSTNAGDDLPGDAGDGDQDGENEIIAVEALEMDMADYSELAMSDDAPEDFYPDDFDADPPEWVSIDDETDSNNVEHEIAAVSRPILDLSLLDKPTINSGNST